MLFLPQNNVLMQVPKPFSNKSLPQWVNNEQGDKWKFGEINESFKAKFRVATREMSSNNSKNSKIILKNSK
jgi:hypothetical protein